jgi:hypothetical protein
MKHMQSLAEDVPRSAPGDFVRDYVTLSVNIKPKL